MIFKKSGKSVFGVSFSAKEEEVLRQEIRKQCADFWRKHSEETVAVVLWHLYEQYGFREKRLRKFYETLEPAMKALAKRYEMGEEDEIWLCTKQLKDSGIDIEKWENDAKS